MPPAPWRSGLLVSCCVGSDFEMFLRVIGRRHFCWPELAFGRRRSPFVFLGCAISAPWGTLWDHGSSTTNILDTIIGFLLIFKRVSELQVLGGIGFKRLLDGSWFIFGECFRNYGGIWICCWFRWFRIFVQILTTFGRSSSFENVV